MLAYMPEMEWTFPSNNGEVPVWQGRGTADADWVYPGKDGVQTVAVLVDISPGSHLGRAVPAGDYRQTELDIHLVDRIARVLFHESSDRAGQEAIAWVMLNRLLKEGSQYTTSQSDSLTLYNIVTAADQFEVFLQRHNTNPQQPSAYRPLEWIAGLEDPNLRKAQQNSWENSVAVAQYLVTAASHPQLDSSQAKREALEAWMPNPFDSAGPYDIWQYRAGTAGPQAPCGGWSQVIGGNIFY